MRLLTDPLLRRQVTFLRLGRAQSTSRGAFPLTSTRFSISQRPPRPPRPAFAQTPRALLCPWSFRAALLRLLQGPHVGDQRSSRTRRSPSAPVTVRAAHAEHDGGRPSRADEGSPLGFVISGSRRIYFAGRHGPLPRHGRPGPRPRPGADPDLGAGARRSAAAGTSIPVERPRRCCPSAAAGRRADSTGAPTVRYTAAPVPRSSTTRPRHSCAKQLPPPRRSRSGC